MSDSVSDFVIGSAMPATPPAAPLRRNRRRHNPMAMASNVALCCYLVVNNALPSPVVVQTKLARTIDREPHYDGDMVAMVGLIYFSWFFPKKDEALQSDDILALSNAALKNRRRAVVCGFVDYIVDFTYFLEEVQHVPDIDELVDGIAFADRYNVSLASCRLGHMTLDDIYAKHHDAKPCNAMVVSI